MANTAYTTEAYLLRSISNLHAGRGDSTYQIVDKEVQRDLLGQKLPVIFSSSLKGAFRELFETGIGETKDIIDGIFGKRSANDAGENASEEDKSTNHSGSHRFFDARLLVLPVRSNRKPFFRGTSVALLRELREQMELFGVASFVQYKPLLDQLINLNPGANEAIVFAPTEDTILEDRDYTVRYMNCDAAHNPLIHALLGEDLALFNEDAFGRVARKLPIIARNSLENGRSVNLWYEEVVPRESRFWFPLSRPVDNPHFDAGLAKNRHTFQVGANASIGYGFSTVRKF